MEPLSFLRAYCSPFALDDRRRSLLATTNLPLSVLPLELAFARLVGLPSTASGIFTSGGSLSTLSAFLCAPTAHLPEDFRLGTVYATDQTHFSTAKALRLLGFPPDA
jgi:hypothetical protein